MLVLLPLPYALAIHLLSLHIEQDEGNVKEMAMRQKGLEPSQLQEPALFKSAASPHFATAACQCAEPEASRMLAPKVLRLLSVSPARRQPRPPLAHTPPAPGAARHQHLQASSAPPIPARQLARHSGTRPCRERAAPVPPTPAAVAYASVARPP